MSVVIDKLLRLFNFLFNFLKLSGKHLYQYITFDQVSSTEPQESWNQSIKIEPTENSSLAKRPDTLQFVSKSKKNFKNGPKKEHTIGNINETKNYLQVSQPRELTADIGSPLPKKIENNCFSLENIPVNDQVISVRVSVEPPITPVDNTLTTMRPSPGNGKPEEEQEDSNNQNAFTPTFNFYPPQLMNNQKFLNRRNSKRFVIGDGEDELPSPNTPNVTVTESPSVEMRVEWAKQDNVGKLSVPSKGLK